MFIKRLVTDMSRDGEDKGVHSGNEIYGEHYGGNDGFPPLVLLSRTRQVITSRIDQLSSIS
jgi:hypothetical protein